MYARESNGRTLQLGVSGLLWENSLVMFDKETGSLWSHILGECMRGPLVGERLEVIPSAMSTWGAWRSRYPETTLVMMPRSSSRYFLEMMSHTGDNLVIALSDGKTTRDWPLTALMEHTLANDTFGDMPVLATIDKPSYTAVPYDRRVKGQTLTFEPSVDGLLIDNETGSTWDPFRGVAVAGELQGERLRRLPGVVAEHATWDIYHTHTDVTLWNPIPNTPPTHAAPPPHGTPPD